MLFFSDDFIHDLLTFSSFPNIFGFSVLRNSAIRSKNLIIKILDDLKIVWAAMCVWR